MSWKDEFINMIKSGMTQIDLTAKLGVVLKARWINATEYEEILRIINEAFE